MIKFKDIPISVIQEIASYAFGKKEWITSEIEVTYQPYIPEWYEDAEEFFEAKFTGYFAGDREAEYRVRLYPDFDVYMWYTYEHRNEKNILHSVSNQSFIQDLLQPYKKQITNLGINGLYYIVFDKKYNRFETDFSNRGLKFFDDDNEYIIPLNVALFKIIGTVYSDYSYDFDTKLHVNGFFKHDNSTVYDCWQNYYNPSVVTFGFDNPNDSFTSLLKQNNVAINENEKLLILKIK